MVEATVFIAAIVGAVRGVKLALPERVSGLVTVAVAVLLGVVLALVDTEIGVTDVTVAQGIILSLAGVGVVNVAEKV